MKLADAHILTPPSACSKLRGFLVISMDCVTRFSSLFSTFLDCLRCVLVGCFILIFFSTDSVACLSEYVTGDTIHWCGGNFGIAFAVLVHGQKIGSSQHSQKKYFSKIPKKVSL